MIHQDKALPEVKHQAAVHHCPLQRSTRQSVHEDHLALLKHSGMGDYIAAVRNRRRRLLLRDVHTIVNVPQEQAVEASSGGMTVDQAPA
jgi:hypothetical protein